MIRKLTKEDYTVSGWSGGKTVQVAIGPEGAVYADRTFLWRVSSATVELAESDYTALPDYRRFITPLSGQMILSHNGGEEYDVEPFEVYEFDGADSTHCRGVCTDFNLMLRKGKAGGAMSVLEPDGENSILIYPVGPGQTIVLFAAEGTARLVKPEDEEAGTARETVAEIGEGEAVILTEEDTETLLEADGEPVLIACNIELFQETEREDG